MATTTNRYAEAERNPNGPGDSRVTALQVLKDNDMEGKLAKKVILITGTSSGIGIETARVMALTGATVFCAARDDQKNREALSGILGKIEFLKMDLSSLASTRAAANEFLKRSGGKLNILINNAGVMALPERELTKDGFEMQFGTNHLGHFFLFQLLKSILIASSTPEFNSRVICLSSSGHRMGGGIHPENYNFDGNYEPWAAYGQSKTANIYMANEIERKYGPQGLHGLSVNPGNVSSPLQKHVTPEQWAAFRSDPKIRPIMKSTEQGAATTTLAAIGKEYEQVGGRFLENVGEWGAVKKPIESVVDLGYEEWAFDVEKAGRLWKDSCKMVGVQDD